MRVLVVGGCGFVGRYLVDALLEDGVEVVVVDSMAITPSEPLNPQARFVEADIARKAGAVAEGFSDSSFDAVYWLAAKQGYNASVEDFHRVNVMPFFPFFRSAKTFNVKIGRFILASSQAVYSPGYHVTESWGKGSPSDYGWSKWIGEQTAGRLCFAHDIPFFALRYSIILGRGQSMDSAESGCLRNWWRDFQEERAPQVYGDGKQLRDFVHVEDVTHANMAVLRCATHLEGAYNVGGISHTVNFVAGRFASTVGAHPPEVTNTEHRPGGEYTLTSCSDAFSERFGWGPELTVEKQISDFVKGLKDGRTDGESPEGDGQR